MCNCKNKPGFKEKLIEAGKMTESTGEQYVAFHLTATDSSFVAKEADITDDFGVCCYFLPDGTEKLYVSSAEVSKMGVTGEQEEKAATKAKKQKQNEKNIVVDEE